MSLKATIKVGNTTIQAEGKDIKDLIKQIGFFGELPAACKCGSKNIGFRHRTAQDYEFFSLLCADCGMEFAFGQKKDMVSLYPKGPWAKYEPNQQQSSSRQAPVDDDDDQTIPF
jgi:hypothetical protein